MGDETESPISRELTAEELEQVSGGSMTTFSSMAGNKGESVDKSHHDAASLDLPTASQGWWTWGT